MASRRKSNCPLCQDRFALVDSPEGLCLMHERTFGIPDPSDDDLIAEELSAHQEGYHLPDCHYCPPRAFKQAA